MTVIYELTVILRITDNVESLKETVKNILQKYGVSIISEDSWDVRKLSYEISGENEGYYLFMTIDSKPDSVQKIIREYRLNSDILRYFFIKQIKEKQITEKAAS